MKESFLTSSRFVPDAVALGIINSMSQVIISERVHSSLVNHTPNLYLFSRFSLQCKQCMNDKAASGCITCVSFCFAFVVVLQLA